MGVPKRSKLQTSRVVRWIAVGMVCIAAAGCEGQQPDSETQNPDSPDVQAEADQTAQAESQEHQELASCAKRLVSMAAVAEDRVQQVLGDVLLLHDKQKVRVNGQYGAMACAAAVRDLSEEDSLTQGKGVLVAMVQVDGQNVPEKEDDWWYRPGTTCVYLLRTSNNTYSALTRLLEEDTCPENPGATDTIGVLASPRGQTPADYPPTVRWDYDTTTAHMYLGLTCGRRWCTILGDSINEKGKRLPRWPQTGPAQERIKGWGDEQFVAVRDNEGNAVPSSLALRLVPDRNLAKWWTEIEEPTQPIPELDTATIVATIYVPRRVPSNAETALQSYASRWALKWQNSSDKLRVGDQVQIVMTRTSRDSAVAVYNVMRNNTKVASSDTLTVIREEDDPATKAALRTLALSNDQNAASNSNKKREWAPPGTARWGWPYDDESAWVRCGYGCCRVGDK